MAIISIIVSLVGFAASFLLGFPLSYLAGPFIGFAAGAAGFVLGIIARTGQRTAVSFAAFAIGLIVLAVSILRMVSLMACIGGIAGMFANIG